MSLDPELRAWQEGWKAGSKPVAGDTADIRAEAARQESRLRLRFAAESVVALLLLIGSFVVAWIDRRAEMIFWAGYVWVATLMASAFSVWNWQTLWKASATSVSDFTALYRSRAFASIRAATTGIWLLGVQVGVVIVWFATDLAGRRIRVSKFAEAMALLVLLTLLIGFGLIRLRAKAMQELRRIGSDGE
jgi:hypothetical protein